jgi:hypothetical protein
VKEYALAQLDRQEAELLSTREALSGINITNVIAINFAITIAAFSDNVASIAGQAVGAGS